MRRLPLLVALLALSTATIAFSALPSEAQSEISTQAVAMSGHGHIAGIIWRAGSSAEPFLWERGTFTNLDPDGRWSWNWSLGVDVNDHGQVVASGVDPNGVDNVRALLFDHGRAIDLLGDETGIPIAINNRGEVVGLHAPGDLLRGFFWDGKGWTDLGPTVAVPYLNLPTFAYAMFLNDRGEVVAISDPPTESFLWSKGQKTPLDFLVTGINQRGQVIGNSGRWEFGPPAESRAFLWEDGVRIDLGTLGGTYAFASVINDKGQVGGVSSNAAGEFRAFLWEAGVMSDIGVGSLYRALSVEAINDRGQMTIHNRLWKTDGWFWDGARAIDIPARMDPACLCFIGPGTMLDDHGRVAFNTFPHDSFDSFLWDDGVVTPLAPQIPTPIATIEGGSELDATTFRSGGALSPGDALDLAASPNPSVGATGLRYALPSAGHATIDVFDVRGTRVRRVTDAWQSAGAHAASWDGNDAGGRRTPAGLYYARLQAGAGSRTAKLIRGR